MKKSISILILIVLCLSGYATPFGNTNNGTVTDFIGNGWPTYCKYVCASNIVASNMLVKVIGSGGNYKFGVYREVNGTANLVQFTQSIKPTSNGWYSVNFTNLVYLTNSQSYWLVAWSDNDNSGVYHTGTGACRWLQLAYGVWPATLPGGNGLSSLNYCFYMTNIVAGVPISPPSAPGVSIASLVTNTSFTANWTPSSGATGYRLDVSLNNIFTNFINGYSNLDVSNVLSKSVSNLIANTTYYYRVRAYSPGGTSINSAVISQTTLVNPSVSPTNTITNTISMTLKWDYNTDPSTVGYKFYVGFSSRNYAGLYDVGPTNYISLDGLIPGVTYYFGATAYAVGGLESDFSNEIVFNSGNNVLKFNSMKSLNGFFIMTFNGYAGFAYIIQATSDFVNWTPVYTTGIQQTNGIITIVDGQTLNYPFRFYRVKVQ